MSNEEAIMIIQAIPNKIWEQLDECEREAMDMAFKALEKQHLMLELPVAEGSTVYVVDYIFNCKHEYECPLYFSDKYKCEEDIRCEHEYKEYRVRDAKFNHRMIDKIGETVFLTEEEAEQKLKKLVV